MTALDMLTELYRSVFSLWTLLLCLICIFGIVLAIRHRRYRFAAFSLFPLMSTYFLWQVLFDIHLVGGTKQIAAISRKLGGSVAVLAGGAFRPHSGGGNLVSHHTALRKTKHHACRSEAPVRSDALRCVLLA